MFNSMKQAYKIYKPQITTDSYNQEQREWEEIGSENIFIALNSHAARNTDNALFAQECEWIGVTTTSSIVEQGFKVDKYEVVFVVDAGRERFLYLKDYGR